MTKPWRASACVVCLVAIRTCDIVAECADGAEAVNVLLDTAADLLFLDVQMPGMDGFAVLRAVPSE
jgi:two-component system LytT family response regulator